MSSRAHLGLHVPASERQQVLLELLLALESLPSQTGAALSPDARWILTLAEQARLYVRTATCTLCSCTSTLHEYTRVWLYRMQWTREIFLLYSTAVRVCVSSVLYMCKNMCMINVCTVKFSCVNAFKELPIVLSWQWEMCTNVCSYLVCEHYYRKSRAYDKMLWCYLNDPTKKVCSQQMIRSTYITYLDCLFCKFFSSLLIFYSYCILVCMNALNVQESTFDFIEKILGNDRYSKHDKEKVRQAVLFNLEVCIEFSFYYVQVIFYTVWCTVRLIQI